MAGACRYKTNNLAKHLFCPLALRAEGTAKETTLKFPEYFHMIKFEQTFISQSGTIGKVEPFTKNQKKDNTQVLVFNNLKITPF